ncbi:hypothetical protein CVS40_1791 [Lucilia cuprina]|nr:hypothetical protein CVS40_1791 [Lucilia cuprina]
MFKILQVTLEEQMICGALQTLNEDAFEDVASSERPSPSGLPTGEMIAAAAQLHLAPIRESSEFGSPSDEQKFNNNLLPYSSNNNNNINNNNNNSNNFNTTTQQMQNKQATNATIGYNRSASSNSLHSLSGSIFMGNGLNNSTITTNNTVNMGAGIGNIGSISGGIGIGGSGNNLRHSIGDGAHLLSASNVTATTAGSGSGVGVRGLAQRHHSVGDDLLCQPFTPPLRNSSNSNSGIPTVVVIPNTNGDQATTHHIVDDTRL